MAALARKPGTTAKARGSQEVSKKRISVSLSESDGESSLTITPLSQRQAEGGQDDQKKSSRSRSAISLKSRHARSRASSRSATSESCTSAFLPSDIALRERAESRHGRGKGSGSSEPSQERRYLPSIASKKRSRSVRRSRSSRKRRSVSNSKPQQTRGEGKQGEGSEKPKADACTREEKPHLLDRHKRQSRWGEKRVDERGKMCITHEAEMDSQRLRKELREAAEAQSKKFKDEKQAKQRQEKEVQRASTPVMEVRQSPVTGAQVRYLTDPLTKKVDKSVDHTTWPYAQRVHRKGPSHAPQALRPPRTEAKSRRSGRNCNGKQCRQRKQWTKGGH